MVAMILLGMSIRLEKAFSQPSNWITDLTQPSQVDAIQLLHLGQQYLIKGHSREALKLFQQALEIYRIKPEPLHEAETLIGLGEAYNNLSEYDQAIESLEKALRLCRNNQNTLAVQPQTVQPQQHRLVGRALGILGEVHNNKGQSVKALETLQLALVKSREMGDLDGEAETLHRLGAVYNDLNQYHQSLKTSEQSLSIYRTLKNRLGEGRNLQLIGLSYRCLAQYAKALEVYQQAKTINQETGDLLNQGRTLSGLGAIYYNLGKYSEALQSYQQALTIRRSIGDRLGEGGSLNGLGVIYARHGETAQALKFYSQALAISRTIGSLASEENILTNLGGLYYSQGDYSKALELYQKAFAIVEKTQDLRRKSIIFNNFGSVYSGLGQFSQALDDYRQALAIQRTIEDKANEAVTLDAIGSVYLNQSQYFRALASYQEALKIRQAIGEQAGIGATLNNIGLVYDKQGQFSGALETYQQALAVLQMVGDPTSEGLTLNSIGIAYVNLAQPKEALESFQQALSILRKINNRSGESATLNNIAYLLAQQNQPELAIVFYKQSINITEAIRQDLHKLPRNLQESYIQSVSSTYRALANLLLDQGRVLEAQQVLELLKIQELRNYTRDTRAGKENKGVPLNAVEAPVKPPFDTLIALGLKLTACESQRPRCAERDQLLAERQSTTNEFDQQAARLRRLAREQGIQDPAQLQQEELTVAAAKIVKAVPKTVLIYPLVLEKKLWLVYGLQAGKEGVVFASKEIPVSRKELSETVTQFRSLLENSTSNVTQLQQVSQKLYGWLIAPLRSQLDGNGIQTLVFSLDRSTRYMPFAALFDGQQYLVQRFTLSTILTAGLTNTTDRLSPNPADNAILGLGLSQEVSGFNALPNVPAEIDAIVRSQSTDPQGVFQGRKYLNQAFTLNAFKDLIDYRILHIATHGKFVSGDPEQSFLLLGNGSFLKVSDIRKLSDLGSIHLAVLSACETAKGGQDKEGIEVAGLSYYFLAQNVKSVVASLWLVNDASTSLLMQQFYQHLATGKQTKAEALRQAQLELLQGKVTAKDAPARATLVVTGAPPRSLSGNFSHPYYWAPFILIGNGL